MPCNLDSQDGQPMMKQTRNEIMKWNWRNFGYKDRIFGKEKEKKDVEKKMKSLVQHD